VADLYSFDREERYLLIRGEDFSLTATWSRDGAIVTPSPGTVRVRRPGGADVLAATAFNVSANVASYTLPAAATADLALEEGWLVQWESVGLPDGSTRSFVAEAALVRYVLSPPARVQDLYQRVARLDPTHPSPLVSSSMDLQAKLDDAWREIERRLYVQGRRPELVMSPTQFRIPHRELGLALIFEDLRTANWEAYGEIAEGYRARFEQVWDELVFSYDADEDGFPDGGSTPTRVGADSTLWLTSRGGASDPQGSP